ncbi:MAG: hypothetical protein M1820_001227 [Bogoriella megaspora]|nr:MAG: hypothetical protein M1820_001227 [Bogoriella megaspora]
MAQQSAQWVRDEIDPYHLYTSVVVKFLREKFGPDGKYDVQEPNHLDKILFNVPRKLTDKERDELLDLRVE